MSEKSLNWWLEGKDTYCAASLGFHYRVFKLFEGCVYFDVSWDFPVRQVLKSSHLNIESAKEAALSHHQCIRSAHENDPVRKKLVEAASELANQLKNALKALPNPDHDEPCFTGKRWFHASERTEIEQSLVNWRAALASAEKGEV